jgi:hypothetical protein
LSTAKASLSGATQPIAVDSGWTNGRETAQ